ncbi:MAG: g-type lysozyme inhibitor [Acidobacteria bacterium]|nr:g-type lysozyme inhibitor [Acidobacteriota bacterium]
MKKFAAAVLTLTFLLAPSVPAKTVNVKFPKGRTTVVLKGRTTGGPSESGGMDPITYRLRAKRGQTMTLHLTSAKKNAIFGVWAPGMDPMDLGQNPTDWSGKLPKTGAYEISVWPEDEATDTTFTLEITIRNAP